MKVGNPRTSGSWRGLGQSPKKGTGTMSNQKHQYKDIGGQAVMEGVMMQSPSDESIAIAVRRPNGRIMVTCKHNEPLSKKHKWGDCR